MAAKKSAEAVQIKRLYGIKELVSTFGATVWFWRTQIWSGELPFIKAGNKMFIDGSDVEKFIEKSKQSYAG